MKIEVLHGKLLRSVAGDVVEVNRLPVGPHTVNLCLVTIKHKNPSCTNITVPQKYVFDFKEYIFPINTFTFHRLEYIS